MAEFRKPEIKHNRRVVCTTLTLAWLGQVSACSSQCHRNHQTSFIPTLFHSDFNVPTWALRRHKLGLLLWPDKCGICPPASARASYPHTDSTLYFVIYSQLVDLLTRVPVLSHRPHLKIFILTVTKFLSFGKKLQKNKQYFPNEDGSVKTVILTKLLSY